MKTINELNENILKITMTIQNTFPELSKYLTEMPATINDERSPKIDNKTLQEYLNFLNILLSTYTKNRPSTK